MDLQKAFNDVLGVVKGAVPLIETFAGTPLIGAAVKVGEAALQLGQQIRANHATDEQAELDAALADLEARVSAHVDETAASLRG